MSSLVLILTLKSILKSVNSNFVNLDPHNPIRTDRRDRREDSRVEYRFNRGLRDEADVIEFIEF